MISREKYIACLMTYQHCLTFEWNVRREVKRLMGIPGPFVPTEPFDKDEDILDLIVDAAGDTHGVTRRFLNGEVLNKDGAAVMVVPIGGDKTMEFPMEGMEDAYDCIAALRVLR